MSNTDPFLGTWKLDVGKSKFSPVWQAMMKTAPPKEETSVIREVGADEFEMTITGILTDGKPLAVKATFPRQGGAVKLQQGPFPEGMAIVSTRIDSNNGYATYLLNGKQVFVAQNVISENGKTMQVTTRGMDAQGKPFEQLLVLAKQ
jgi:hypothetical protein